MSLKVLVLKSKEDVLAEVAEILVDDQIVGYNLKNPRALTLSQVRTINEEVDPTRVGVNFTKWQIYSDDTEFQIPADWVVTICEPLESLRKSYEGKLNATEHTSINLNE
tara:strand:+ start:64 stop:390 length:327 start_codon:yes stop_codon:yes gene_type:complete